MVVFLAPASSYPRLVPAGPTLGNVLAADTTPPWSGRFLALKTGAGEDFSRKIGTSNV